MDFKECKNTDNTPCEGSLDVGRGCSFCRLRRRSDGLSLRGLLQAALVQLAGDMPEVFPTDISRSDLK